ncbi:MAG: hypothetical protein AAFR87_05880 [Bacteroidota bacterium]
MNKLISFLLLSLLFSCTSITEDEAIRPIDNSMIESTEALSEDKANNLAKRNKTCRCNFTTEVSPNLVGEEWDVTFRVEENGQDEVIELAGTGVPVLSNPFTFSRHELTPLQVIPTSMRLLYGDPDQALDDEGWIKVKIACQQAPSVSYTLKVPTYDLSGSVFTEKLTQITSSCGTIEVTKE